MAHTEERFGYAVYPFFQGSPPNFFLEKSFFSRAINFRSKLRTEYSINITTHDITSIAEFDEWT